MYGIVPQCSLLSALGLRPTLGHISHTYITYNINMSLVHMQKFMRDRYIYYIEYVCKPVSAWHRGSTKIFRFSMDKILHGKYVHHTPLEILELLSLFTALPFLIVLRAAFNQQSLIRMQHIEMLAVLEHTVQLRRKCGCWGRMDLQKKNQMEGCCASVEKLINLDQ